MQSIDARRRADAFFALHAGPNALVLVDAWDAASARLIERAGARAIGTTSAAIAWSLGYATPDDMPIHELLAACERICRVVNVPVTVDIARGVRRDTGDLCTLVRGLIDLGVAGLTIEDGPAASRDALRERIGAVRALGDQMHARFFVNAGIASHHTGKRNRDAWIEDAVQSAQACAAAGADGVVAPAMDAEAIARFTRAVMLPVTVGVGDGWAAPVHGLQRVGVRRISLGHGPFQASFAALRRVVIEALDLGTYDTMNRTMLSANA